MEDKKSPNRKEARSTDVVIAVATVFIFLASVVQAVAIFLQYTEMKAAGRQTEESMEVSTRAYLAMAQIKIYCPICETGKIRPPEKPNDNNASINIFFVNSGHSPATEIDTATMLRVTDEPRDKNFSFPELPDVLPQPKHMTIQPSVQFPLQITRGTRAEIILTARGAIPGSGGSYVVSPLYVYGHVSYTDAFHKRHTLLFCAQYQKPSEVSPESWSACARHNEEYDGDYAPGKE